VPTEFKGMGISFLYPENWDLDEEETDGRYGSVSIYGPSGAFLSIGVHPPRIDPLALARGAVDGILEEYGDVDVEEAQQTIAGRELVGYDLNFFCMDLTSTAKVRCLRTSAATYSVFSQAEDGDFERLARVFEAVTASLLGSLLPCS
jgi:hypothetical protein